MNRTSVSMCLSTKRPAPLDDPQVLTVFIESLTNTGTGNGIRTRVTCLKGTSPGPLADIPAYFSQCVRGSNPWTPPWQGGMIASFTNALYCFVTPVGFEPTTHWVRANCANPVAPRGHYLIYNHMNELTNHNFAPFSYRIIRNTKHFWNRNKTIFM